MPPICTDMFGGNSNWRGPVWMPINYLLIESLCRFGPLYGDGFRVECPGLRYMLSLGEVADELRNRLTRIFLRGAHGRRPVSWLREAANRPAFQGLHLVSRYFDGDNGRGLGASHQTGWTGLIANLIDEPIRPIADDARQDLVFAKLVGATTGKPRRRQRSDRSTSIGSRSTSARLACRDRSFPRPG